MKESLANSYKVPNEKKKKNEMSNFSWYHFSWYYFFRIFQLYTFFQSTCIQQRAASQNSNFKP